MSTLMDMISHHVQPWIFLFTSLSHIPRTLFASRDANSPSFREAWFLSFWSKIGPPLHEGVSPLVVALLQGRASGGAVTDEAGHGALGGTVVEIGAATGLWAKTLAEQPGVDRVFGVEPNRASGRVLKEVVEREGLGEKYTIVPAGIEDAGEWVERGSVDCIVTILCMCSIPDPDKIAKEVYGYLKPGGRWYVFEHVRADGVGWWMQFYQGMHSPPPNARHVSYASRGKSREANLSRVREPLLANYDRRVPTEEEDGRHAAQRGRVEPG